ncbi:CRISPR system precrRNA processing endoribonuclease RAMP protein Cas6 [Stygiolobus caldivivus]|uniref:CRISPR system precrRNA processing endoribonuclease RAMP protein Cas6 n=1 Tax=Stygiolobus caldivivus TaxID=2824673 RepID=UPI001CED2A28|nr:CRISPR system precrRNA processing endoribonuclease RAMP protein Cas6 [Stygiolobus caldivivus]
MEFARDKVVRVDFFAVPENDVVLPPLSSKVVKNLILTGEVLPSLSALVQSGAKNKPLFISNMGVKGKRLLSTGGKPKAVKAGESLDFYVSFPYYDGFFTEVHAGFFDTPYGKFYVYPVATHIVDLTELGGVDVRGKNFLVGFKTPTLLSSKVLLPPALREKYKGVNAGYTLIPSVGLVLSYAYRTFRALTGDTSNVEYDVKAYKLGVLGNALSKVVGYDLRPETVVIGRDDKGRVRATRGFVGWVEFDISDKRLKRAVSKYLLVASLLGVGKSRGIGLGEVVLTLRDPKRVGGTGA